MTCFMTTPIKSRAPGCVIGGSNFSQQPANIVRRFFCLISFYLWMCLFDLMISLGTKLENLAFDQFWKVLLLFSRVMFGQDRQVKSRSFFTVEIVSRHHQYTSWISFLFKSADVLNFYYRCFHIGGQSCSASSWHATGVSDMSVTHQEGWPYLKWLDFVFSVKHVAFRVDTWIYQQNTLQLMTS